MVSIESKLVSGRLTVLIIVALHDVKSSASLCSVVCEVRAMHWLCLRKC